jgi:hypothetical protein
VFPLPLRLRTPPPTNSGVCRLSRRPLQPPYLAWLGRVSCLVRSPAPHPALVAVLVASNPTTPCPGRSAPVRPLERLRLHTNHVQTLMVVVLSMQRTCTTRSRAQRRLQWRITRTSSSLRSRQGPHWAASCLVARRTAWQPTGPARPCQTRASLVALGPPRRRLRSSHVSTPREAATRWRVRTHCDPSAMIALSRWMRCPTRWRLASASPAAATTTAADLSPLMPTQACQRSESCRGSMAKPRPPRSTSSRPRR